MFGLALFALGSAKILADDFTYNLTMSWCYNLTAQDKSVDTESACAELCEGDKKCDAYLFCPWGTRCSSPDGKWWGKSVCLTGSPDTCVPFNKGTWHWNGWAKTAVAPEGRTKAVTKKRGFSGFQGGVATCEDAKALGLQDSWYYTWMTKSMKYDGCVTNGVYPSDQGAEFVPMIESISGTVSIDDKTKQDWIWGNAQFLLGYNEPDQPCPSSKPTECGGADSASSQTGQDSSDTFREDPVKAAKHWPQVQAAANLFDPPLILVSPAPLDHDITDEGVSAWLDSFFAECDKLKDCNSDDIEYIAMHDYTGDIDTLNSTLWGMHNRYVKSDGTKRLIWITEIGVGQWLPATNGPLLDVKIKYMKELLPFLDAHPVVYRYAWYTARTTGEWGWSGPTSLLPNATNGMDLTELGQLYKDM